MSYLARLKETRPDVDWDAEIAAAREREARAARSWYWRMRHWAHARKHPQLHAQSCSECRKTVMAVYGEDLARGANADVPDVEVQP